MFKKSCLFVFLMIMHLSFFAKGTEPLIKIEGPEGLEQSVSAEEFLRVYRKNNTGVNDNQKSIQNYLDLFIRFKLKVLEAQRLGYDTLPEFKSEYKQYRDQLMKPYLVDKDKREEMIRNAYERMNKEVELAHILFKVNFDQASAQDTLDAWNKAMDVRKKISKGKYDFEQAAVEFSDDPTAKKNQGYLGFVTAFKFPYHFEKEAFELDQDDITKPVKTKFGYHLIKKMDEREARGQIKVKHILKAVPKNMSQSKKDSIEVLVKGIHDSINEDDVSFEEMARRYSDDKRTSSQGGELPWFGVGQMIPEFTELAFSLEDDGAVSEPRNTYIGWHILKRIGHRPVPDFDQASKEIEKAIEKGERADVLKSSFVSGLKDEYDFKINQKRLKNVLNLVDSHFLVQSDLIYDQDNYNHEVFSFSDVVISEYDLLQYLHQKRNQIKKNDQGKQLLASQLIDDLVEQRLMEYEKQNLQNKYDEFKFLSEEYHDGILLFNIMNDSVWNLAIRDSSGIRDYFEEHQSDYISDSVIHIIQVINPGNDKNDDQITDILKEYDRVTPIEKQLAELDSLIDVQVKYFEREEARNDSIPWESGLVIHRNEDDVNQIFKTINIEGPRLRSFEKVRGAVVSDYQDYLEEQWMKSLENKYEVDVNQDLLESIQ